MGSTSERLPSFKGPRDLSLSARGGKREGTAPGPSGDAKTRPRRVFTPNIPPKRDRGATSSGASGDRQSTSSGGKDAVGGVPGFGARGRQQRGRGGGQRGGAGAGRGIRPRGELVQFESIFSDGIANPTEAKRSSAIQYKTGYGSSSRYKSDGGPSRVSSMNRSTLKTIIKEEESESDKKIFGEETLEVEDEEETEPSNPLVAVSLPLISYVPEFFMEPKILDSGPVPGTSTGSSITEPVIKIKQEKIDDDDPVAPSLILVKQEKSDGDDEISKANELNLLAAIPLEPSSFAGTFRGIPPEGTLAYFQLPDELPVLQGNVRNSTDSRDGSKNSAELVQDINDLPDGIIGKLQILSTGRTRFILGENSFDVDPGRPVGFRQELHALDTENKTLVNLGSDFHLDRIAITQGSTEID